MPTKKDSLFRALFWGSFYVLPAPYVHADCTPSATSHSDSITCDGARSAPLNVRSGNDTVTVLPGAEVDIQSAQSVAALDGGSGNDTVTNDGRVAATVDPILAPATSSASKSAACPQATAIAGGSGNDKITNRGTVAATAKLPAQTAPNCGSSGHRYGNDHSTKTAASIGVAGGEGRDHIDNSGSVEVSTSADVNGAPIAAKGIVGDSGDDTITNAGTVTVTAQAEQVDVAVVPFGTSAHGGSSEDQSDTTSVTAVGIEGGSGNDKVDNQGNLTVGASANVGNVAPSLTLAGGDDVVATTTIEARAVGIDGGTGKDHVTNSGAVTVNATSGVDNVDVKLSLIDLSTADTSAYVRSQATGIDAGAGKDYVTVTNTGTIAANATSTSGSVAVEISAINAATADSLLEVQSAAVGITGGHGKTAITNSGTINAAATSEADSVSVGVSFIDATIARPPGDSSTTLDADAFGIDGRKGESDVDITETGVVNATATSRATSVGVGVGFEGLPGDTVTLFEDGGIAEVGTTSNSNASGIAGGYRGDDVSNLGRVTANATSSAKQVEVDVGLGLVDLLVPLPGMGLVGAGTAANATATGIDTDGGDDEIFSSGVVKSDATADADAAAFAVSIGVYSIGPQLLPVGAGLTAADVATTASAKAQGIDGGSGDDKITNTGSVETQATANAGAISVSGSLDIDYEPGEKLFTVNAVAARAVTEATAETVGIDSGSGRNRLQNDGAVTAGADADAFAVGATVGVSGPLRGAGLAVTVTGSDTSSTGSAEAIGVRGGSDDDTIKNTGSITANADADVASASAAVGVSIAKQGLVVGVSLARAESTATATATGIDGAGGEDDIENTGTIGATADATAVALAVSISVEGTAEKGVAGGAALTDTRTTATATATGIKTGDADKKDGHDKHHGDKHYDDKHYGDKHYDHKDGSITNANAITVDAEADALNLSASINVGVAKEGIVVGAALADARSTSQATAKGIEGNGDDNAISNTGSIAIKTDAHSTAISASANVEGTTRGLALGGALVEANVNATSNAAGIDGGAGDDRLSNSGSITFETTNATATAVGVSRSVVAALKGAALGGALANTSSDANSTAAALAGGAGDDKLTNSGTIAVNNTTADSNAVSVSISAALSQNGVTFGGALAFSDNSATAVARGLDGGADDDFLLNQGSVNLTGVEADADAVSVSLGIAGAQNGLSLGGALVDADAKADASGFGLTGGDGKDALISVGSVTVDDVHANSDAVGVSVGVAFSQNGVAVGGALAETGTESNALAKGLDGGDDRDLLYTEGNVTVQSIKADATAVSVSVGAAGTVNGLSISAGLADASGDATTTAAALDGGADEDVIVNRATVGVQDIEVNASAWGFAVQLAGTNAGVAGGFTLIDSSGTATTNAKGIDGGTGDDALLNKEALTVQRIGADALAVSGSVAVSAAITGGVAAGVALGDTRATASTHAAGMDGNAGDDAIANFSSITLNDIESNTDAIGASVQVGVTYAGVALGGAVVDASSTATTTAKGIDGGSGDDLLFNAGAISLNRIKADANAVSTSVSGNLTLQGGVAAGVAMTDSSGTANTTAIGMDGGSGRDTLVNTGSIGVQDAESTAHATGVSVSLQGSFAGVAAGAALSDTSGTATTIAKGIDGGADDDEIYNKGTVDVRGKSKADATSVSVGVAATIGVGGGLQIANASTTAETTAMGIDGGSGRDEIDNKGAVSATAEAASESTSVSIGVTVAVGGDATIADAESSATATAVGINDEDDDKNKDKKKYSKKDEDHHGHHGHYGYHYEPVNEIDNAGAITASATSTSKGAAVSGNLIGYALGETSNTATANATGINTGGTRDAIKNEGTINAASNATATGLSVSVSLAGAAMGNASSTAEANATGIDTGADDDEVENLAALTISANSQAAANGISVGTTGFSSADASTVAVANATGLNTGDGEDKIINRSAITVSAGETNVPDGGTGCSAAAGGACARVGSVGVRLIGASQLNAATEARATATGIAAGDDDDYIESDSDGAIDVSAHAKTGASGVNVNIAGASGTDATTTATARADGIAGEDGDDVIKNASAVTASASSDIVVNSTGVTIAGAGGYDATLAAEAHAGAIDGGAGKDKLYNEGSLTSTAAATLSSSGSSNVVFGASGADSESGAVTDAAGMRGGADSDVIWNKGATTARSNVNLALGNSSFTFGGATGADGTLTASSRSTGIAGDDGHDVMFSSGGLTIDAESVLTASGGSTVVFGGSSGGATSGASTTAIGIDGGAHGDGILVEGSVATNARARMTLSGSSFAFGGASGAGGSLAANTLAIGVAGGSGSDAIGNKGDVAAVASSNLNASGGSTVAFGASNGGADAGAITNARGIDGGDDGDFIYNGGKASATANSTLTLSGGSFTFGGSGGTQGSLTATTRATGLAGGGGRDIIKNEGEIRANNTSVLTSSGGSDVAFGSSGASSSAGAVAQAAGIDGGDDADFIWNFGAIFVNSTANLTLGGSSYTFGGTGDVGGRLSATTNSVGIQGGQGEDLIGNEGEISVTAGSTLRSDARVDTTFGTSASGAVVASDIGVTGIDGGAGDDLIKNLGAVTVASSASVTSGSSSYVFGGSTSTNIVAQARANATGLQGGSGNDFVFNSGDVSATASATASSSGSSNAEFGGSSASGEIAASIVARGVDGGAGDDAILNIGTIRATGTTTATSSHNTDTGILFGGGDSVARGSAGVSVFGLDAGEGNNAIWNKGSIFADLYGSVSVTTSSDGADIADGDAFSRSDATLSATAIGIRAGAGNDSIENKGSIDIKTWRRFEFPVLPGLPPLVVDLGAGASATANADGDGIDGDGTIRAFATTTLTAVGIDAGNGTNRIENKGMIAMDVRGRSNAAGSVDSDAGGSTSAIRQARLTARAFGVRTGAGEDYVINKGTISITTRADNNSGGDDVNAGATGIETGGGNDTIINEGTITATRIVNGSSSRGTAINAGAGDDLVKLLDGSVTNGDIDLGSGDDSLMLEGTPVINGGFLNASSAVSLIFNNAGSYAHGLPGVTAIKNGEGTFSLSLLNSMERIEVNQGTLKLNNDYDFLPNGLLQAQVHGNGTNGQFFVNGEAGLNGPVKIVRGGGAFQNGTTYDVFFAAKGAAPGTRFTSIEVPDATRLLKFHAEQGGDNVRVTADVLPFSTVAATPNQMAIARTLDQVLPQSTGDFNQLLGDMQVLGDEQFAGAFASLSPEAYAAYSVAALNSAELHGNVVQERLAVARADEVTRNASRREPIRLAYSGRTLADVMADSEAERARATGIWLRGFGRKGEQDATANANAYGFDLAGATVGYDVRLTRTFTAGFSIAEVRNDVDVQAMSTGDIDSTLVSVYGGYFDRRLYVTGTLAAGRNDYDTRRTGPSATLTSAHEGNIHAASLGIGSYAQLGAWLVDPHATVQYTRLEEDAFTETGGVGAMSVAGRKSKALVSTIGARFSRAIEASNGGRWIPQASLAWLHDYSDEHVVNASYVDAPDATFSVDGQPINRDGALLGLGVSYRTSGGFMSTLQYNGEFRDDFSAHGFVGELRFEF